MLTRNGNEPMRLTIVAATEGVGRELLEQALAARDRVTVVVRDSAKLSRHLSAIAARAERHDASAHGRPVVCVAVTDLADPDAELLELALGGADAVLSALGGRSAREVGMAERSTRALVRAMRAADVRRLVVVGAEYGDLQSIRDVLRESDLEWTIVRPDGADSGFGPGVSRADVARFMLRALEQPQTVGRTIGIAH